MQDCMNITQSQTGLQSSHHPLHPQPSDFVRLETVPSAAAAASCCFWATQSQSRAQPSQVPALYPMFSPAASSQSYCLLHFSKWLYFASNVFVPGNFFTTIFSLFYCFSTQPDPSLSDEHSQNHTNTSP